MKHPVFTRVLKFLIKEGHLLDLLHDLIFKKVDFKIFKKFNLVFLESFVYFYQFKTYARFFFKFVRNVQKCSFWPHLIKNIFKIQLIFYLYFHVQGMGKMKNGASAHVSQKFVKFPFISRVLKFIAFGHKKGKYNS